MQTQIVDWTAGQKKSHRRAGRPLYRTTKYPVTCAVCGTIRWLRASDAHKAEAADGCRHCQQSAAGKAGFAATSKLYGDRFALNFWLAWKQDHPTSLEAPVDALVAKLGVRYQREYVLEGEAGAVYVVDFALWVDDVLYVIEVDGSWVHSRLAHAERDVVKETFIRSRSIPLLRIAESEVHEAHLLERLAAFVGQSKEDN